MFCPPLKPVLTPVARGVHQACGNVVGDVVPLFQELFTDATNDTGFSHTRATAQMVETDTGNLFPVPAGAIPIQKARPARNLAASSDTPSTQNITVVVGRIYAVRIGDESASGATAVCSGAFTGTLTGDAADPYALNGVATTTTLTVTITGSIRKLQVQDITHRSALSTAPDEYVDSATDYGTGVNGFRYFTTALANTVDGSGVVTEGTGAALTGIALANVPGATNLFTYSAIADGTGWVTGSASLSSVVAPDGSNDAALFADNSAGGTNSPSLRSALITVAASTSYVISVYAKADQLAWLSIRTFGFTSGDGESFFDLSSAAVGAKSANHDASSVEDVANGWCRCSIVFTTDAVDTNGYVYFYVAESDSDRIVDLDGTSSILIWGAQLETGTVPTPYIPTSGSTASTDAAVLDFSGVDGFTTPNETRIVATGLDASLEPDPTDTTERNVDADDWDGTDLSDILPHANIKSVTVYAPGERP